MIVEVCVDSIESLEIAIDAGATRIELCSALALGGLTPSPGFIKQAIKRANIPIYGMVRPRAGDFIFSQQEIDIMLADIDFMLNTGLQGIVVGALTEKGDIDTAALFRFRQAAGDAGLTFHRAFDLCRDPQQALEQLIKHDCERLLTSGLQTSAIQGKEMIGKLREQAAGRIIIMPGAGINAGNVRQLLDETKVTEIHLSGKSRRASHLTTRNGVKMGTAEDLSVVLADYQEIRSVVSELTD